MNDIILDYRMDDYPCYVQDNGRLPEAVGERVRDLLKKFSGKKVYITITESSKKASSKQRKYYFSVIVAEFINYFTLKENKHFTKAQMHDSMMRTIGGFSNPYVSPFTGEPDDGRISYNSLTTAQAEGYHTLCLQWAATKGFQIPLPNEDLSAYE